MTATAAQVAQLRRMTDLVGSAEYADSDLEDYIERYPTMDPLGTEPGYYDTTTSPPTWTENDDWIATYDLAAAAADLWAERASTLAQDYAFSADGGNYSRNQAYEQYMRQSRYWSSRRRPGTIKLFMSPDPDQELDEDLHN